MRAGELFSLVSEFGRFAQTGREHFRSKAGLFAGLAVVWASVFFAGLWADESALFLASVWQWGYRTFLAV